MIISCQCRSALVVLVNISLSGRFFSSFHSGKYRSRGGLVLGFTLPFRHKACCLCRVVARGIEKILSL